MERLLKISLSISLLGILLLLILLNTISPKISDISSLSKEQIGQKVQIKATITNIQNYNNFQVLTLNDSTSQIQVTSSSTSHLNLTKLKYKQATVIGILTTYQDQLQIQAEKIILLN